MFNRRSRLTRIEMRYFIRSLKYFVSFVIFFAAVLLALILFGAADWDLNSIFREGTDALWKIALLFAAVAAFYPKIGFISRQLALNGGKAADRTVISEYMGQLGYVKETDAGDRMTFRMEKTSGRLARMFEDRITVTFSSEEGVVIDGLRKDVVRIAGALEFRFNRESE